MGRFGDEVCRDLHRGREGTVGFQADNFLWVREFLASCGGVLLVESQSRTLLIMCHRTGPLLAGLKSDVAVSWCPLQFTNHAKCTECSFSYSLAGRSWCAAPQNVRPCTCWPAVLCGLYRIRKTFLNKTQFPALCAARHYWILFDFCWLSV